MLKGGFRIRPLARSLERFAVGCFARQRERFRFALASQAQSSKLERLCFGSGAFPRTRFRLAFGGQLALRLFEGLALQLEGTSAWVRDQINVRERPLDDSEILLFTAEQPTHFALEATFGFSYAFGSVHNTIVNPRFGRIDLTED